MNNQIKLAVIVIFTLLLSGFLFWEGLKPEIEKLQTNSTSPQKSEQVLGEQNNVATTSTESPQTIYKEQGKVTKVVDGDTIDVEISGVQKKVRYIGIDTPETVDPRKGVQCFGKEASNENKRLVEGKVVYLEKDVSETDRFGRLLRFVYLKLDDGSLLFVNDYLVRQGFAHAATFPPDVKESQRFKMAETDAKENNRGLWASCK